MPGGNPRQDCGVSQFRAIGLNIGWGYVIFQAMRSGLIVARVYASLLAGLMLFPAGVLAAQPGAARSHAEHAGRGAARAESAEQEPEDSVKATTEGRADGGTNSGRSEGVDLAPEYIPPTEEEQKGDISIVPDATGKGRNDAASQAFPTTRTQARTMAIQIPAPRGPVLDRNGELLAQSEVAYQLSLKFDSRFDNDDHEGILKFARECLAKAHELASQTWEFSDEKLLAHYRDRRWLPLPLTNVIRADAAEKIKKKVEEIPGLSLLPIYIRSYPEKTSASHMIGYVGSVGKLPTGPINHMDPLWEQTVGRSGLEQKFDSALRGKPGVWRLMFDEEGNKVLDELQIHPKPGGAIVTTIDLKWQRAAEKALAQRANKRRGAMVVLDCKTGEVLAMASIPSYDPNKFIPNISQKDYDALRNDPGNPLVSRAFQGKYPPASTFKVVTILAALTHGVINENTTIYCDASVRIGNHTFNNWSKVPAGSINCVKALAMSNNPFMYKASGMLAKGGSASIAANHLLAAARALGFGSVTGLDIPDQEGLVPDDSYMMSVFKRGFTFGDVANMSIGQGVLLATPLQVAHAMAGIANGSGLPKLHLIKQIQDANANVVYAATPEIQTSLLEYEKAAAIVRKGMKGVIEGGTGKNARLNYSSIAGKSGTAQWGPERENRRLAWFAGFMPYDNPRYAYAVLYEGRPGEKLGGGQMAAPIVKTFFQDPGVKADVLKAIKPPEDDIPSAEPVGETAKKKDKKGSSGEGSDKAADDSSDKKPEEPVSPGPIPLPGDVDYIPGLNRQLPRDLTDPPGANDIMAPDVQESPQEEIPDAEPID